MSWQDLVIGIGQALFAVALIPALLGEQKPPRSTCAMTGIILLVFAFTFATLELWWATTTVAICGIFWLILLWQQRKKDSSAIGRDLSVLVHAGCGGEIVEDRSIGYEYEDDDGTVSFIPGYRCNKCRTEILSDAQTKEITR